MSSPRVYQAIPLALNSRIYLTDSASHHLARVLRAGIDDKLTLFNGAGGEYIASIVHIDKKRVEVEIMEYIARDVESPTDIYLAQGIARGEKMDFIVQKAVELGVSKIFPLLTERCNVRLDAEREEKRLQHWQGVIISACEQSGRNRIPEIIAPQTLNAWLANLRADMRLVLSPHVQEKFIFDKAHLYKSVALLIGPEGGLNEQEIQLAQQHKFKAINLGPRVLRTETATIAALTLMQCFFGDIA